MSVTSTSSSIRTPPHPGRYAPGSIVKTMPAATASSLGVHVRPPPRDPRILVHFDARGRARCRARTPRPARGRPATSRAAASMSNRDRPGATAAIARSCASRTASYTSRARVAGRSDRTPSGSGRRSMSRRRRRSPARRGRLRSIVRSPGRACGSAAFGPLATIVSNAGRSNPAWRIRQSMASATSRSRQPAPDLGQTPRPRPRQPARRFAQRRDLVVVLARRARRSTRPLGRRRARRRRSVGASVAVEPAMTARP